MMRRCLTQQADIRLVLYEANIAQNFDNYTSCFHIIVSWPSGNGILPVKILVTVMQSWKSHKLKESKNRFFI